MKKTTAIILALILILSCFAGCGAKNSSDSTSDLAYDTGDYSDDSSYDQDYGNPEDTDTEEYSNLDANTILSSLTSQAASSLSDKIIYTAVANIETIDFDQSVEDVYAMLDTFDAFIENSYVSGSSYASDFYGYQTYRNAEFVIRVPKEYFEAMSSSLTDLGNITSASSDAENITEQYTDTESRLATYETEEARLLAMLEKADTVVDMITIETRLSEVRYEIESLTSTLKNWDNQVNYSTITLLIDEVEELSEKVEIQRTYWEQITDGLNSTLKGIGKFFKDLFKNFIIALPVIIIIAVILAVVIVIYKRVHRRKSRFSLPGTDSKSPHSNNESNTDSSDEDDGK